MTRLERLGASGRRLLAAVSGAAATLGFAPFLLAPIAILAFACLILLLRAERNKRNAFFITFIFGYFHFAVSLHWIAFAFTVDNRFPLALGILAVLLLALPLALYAGFCGIAAFLIDRRIPALLFAALWTLGEIVRGEAFTGMPWNPLGAIWAFSDAAMQGAAIAGIFGLSFVAMLCAAWLADAARNPRMLAAAAAVPLLLAGGGALRLKLTPMPTSGPAIRIVQADIQQDEKWAADKLEDNFRSYLRLARAPAKGAVPAFQIWPEAAVPYLLDEDPLARRMIAAALPAKGLVLTGAVRRIRSRSEETWFNSLMAIDGAARIAGVYDKHHLVPFGEYVPFRSFFALIGLGPLTRTQGDFGTGPGPRTLHLPGLPAVSPLICYEAIFPDEAAPRTDRPAWLAAVTNDAWFGTSIGPYQHFALNRFRAVEQGLPLVRAAGTGISAVTDAFGRVIAQLPLNHAGIIDAALPGALTSTFFSKNGSMPLKVVILLVVTIELFKKYCYIRRGR